MVYLGLIVSRWFRMIIGTCIDINLFVVELTLLENVVLWSEIQ